MKEAIKILNKIYLREVIFATLITLMMIVVSYFTIKKQGFNGLFCSFQSFILNTSLIPLSHIKIKSEKLKK